MSTIEVQGACVAFEDLFCLLFGRWWSMSLSSLNATKYLLGVLLHRAVLESKFCFLKYSAHRQNQRPDFFRFSNESHHSLQTLRPSLDIILGNFWRQESLQALKVPKNRHHGCRLEGFRELFRLSLLFQSQPRIPLQFPHPKVCSQISKTTAT